jgi:hypothetical protein
MEDAAPGLEAYLARPTRQAEARDMVLDLRLDPLRERAHHNARPVDTGLPEPVEHLYLDVDGAVGIEVTEAQG